MALSRIQPHDLHKFRYQLALCNYGRKTLCDVFEWSYQGTYPVKTYLFSRPGYSNTKFKKVYNESQRVKLQTAVATDVQEFDISLLYALLQHVCGLADSNDPAWTNTTQQPSPLEHLLYLLKQLRNQLAHDNQQFTEQILSVKLTELKKLLQTVYRTAAKRFRKRAYLQAKLSEINNYFTGIREKIRESLHVTDFAQFLQLQQELQIFRTEITALVKQEGKTELTTLYEKLCELDPAPWLYLGIRFKPSITFVKLIIEDDKSVSCRPSQLQQARKVEVEDILEVKRDDGTLPDIIILTGEGGIGKTTLSQYTVEKWFNDPQALQHLGDVDLLLYSQCRGSNVSSFEQLLDNLLHSTYIKSNVSFQCCKEIILGLNILVIIDGYDEHNDDSKKMVRDVVNLAGSNMRVVITTRPNSQKELTALIPSGKRILQLVVKGISPAQHPSFVSNMIDLLVKDVSQRDSCKSSLKEKLIVLRPEFGVHLSNPLTLTLITLLWVECPDKVNSLTTHTELYHNLTELITSNLVHRLEGKGFTDVTDNCASFLACHDDLALRSIKRREYELKDDTVRTLKQKCSDLGLPYTDVLSTYYSMKWTRQNLNLVEVWSYQHLRFQEHGAGRSVVKKLQTLAQGSQAAGSKDLEAGENVIKHILTQDCEQCGTDWYKTNTSYFSLLFNVTGILALSDEQMLVKHASEIVEMMIDDDTDESTGNNDDSEKSDDDDNNDDSENNSEHDSNPPSIGNADDDNDSDDDKHSNGSDDSDVNQCGETGDSDTENGFPIPTDDLFRLVVESKSNTALTNVVSQLLHKGDWMVEGAGLTALPDVLAVAEPREVQVSTDLDPDFTPGIQEALRLLSNKTFPLELQLKYHYWIKSSGISDCYLEAVLSGGTSGLRQFMGKLTQHAIPQLPNCLEWLDLRCTPEALPALAATLPTLTQLQNLSNYLWFPFFFFFKL